MKPLKTMSVWSTGRHELRAERDILGGPDTDSTRVDVSPRLPIRFDVFLRASL